MSIHTTTRFTPTQQVSTNRQKAMTFVPGVMIFFGVLLPALNYQGSSTTRNGEKAEAYLIGFQRLLGSAPTPPADSALLLAGRVLVVIGVLLLAARGAYVLTHRRG